LEEQVEISKYDKVLLNNDFCKQRAFIFSDISKLKIYTLVATFMSALNFLFCLLFMYSYKLQNVTNYFFPISMLLNLLASIFGQISVIRVEQKHEKYYFSNLSGAFSFEALMIYFRLNMISIPLMMYHAVQICFNVDRYIV
jgi:hypothetical protein